LRVASLAAGFLSVAGRRTQCDKRSPAGKLALFGVGRRGA